MNAADGISLVNEHAGEKRSFILATKLYTPQPHATLVNRPHLLKQLDLSLDSQLTIVSAPAGFGKTTLVAEWIQGFKAKGKRQKVESLSSIMHPSDFVWVSLDNNDNDPVRFLTYFIAGLQKIGMAVGEAALDWLQSATDSPTEAVLAALINDVIELPHDIILILDDFHLITEPAIHEAFTFLLDNQPPNLHLIIISRADPPWPLARLRVRRQLNEIRARDLRFTPAETAVFLNNIMGLDLSPEDVATLDKQTEGWIAGLQMAALSMQNREDMAVFIQNFNARHTFILDYLVEEVLERQPASTQTFLLKTAILERMTAPLCDVVTEYQGSQTILNQLDKVNLFLVPLDDERCWYRYHRLFADLLRSQLEKSQPDLLPVLHRRASEWFDQADFPDEAIAHALAGQDIAQAAILVEKNAFAAMKNNREVTLSGWLETLPPEEIRKRPWLCVAQAYINQWMGRRNQIEDYLHCAERSLPANNFTTEERRLAGHIATMRAHDALIDGDIPTVVRQSEQALALLSEADESSQGTIRVALGGAYWAMGDVVAAEKTFALAAEYGKKAGDRMLAGPATCYVGMQQTKRGRLHEAWATYQEVREMSVRSDGRPMPAAGFPLIKMGDLQREWNDLATAQQFLEQGVELCERMSQSDVLTDAYVNLARLRSALGDGAGAALAIQEADNVIAAAPVDLWLTCWLDECRLRYWLSNGDVDTAVHWANSSALTVHDELSYHHDLHHINLARVLVAQGMRELSKPYLDEAQTLLTRLLAAAEKADWVHETIKILILRALAWQAAGEEGRGTAVLTHALTLAEPGGYVRLFIDEGEPIRRLLRQVEPSGYARRLLAEMEDDGGGTAVPPYPDLTEPLSQRELDVLRLLNTHLSSTEIAKELFIAPSTVRSHIKNIYSKLNVHRRAEAVVRAEELNLL